MSSAAKAAELSSAMDAALKRCSTQKGIDKAPLKQKKLEWGTQATNETPRHKWGTQVTRD